MHHINLKGSDGNPFAIIGIGSGWLKQMGESKADIDAFTKEAMAGDFKHVLDTFDAKFKDRIDYKFIGDPRNGEGDDDSREEDYTDEH